LGEGRVRAMKQYVIDGNNLIGKIRSLSKLQKKDKQGVREQVVFLVQQYFYGKKVNVTLHLDGHSALPINFYNGKIIYSGSKTADEKIKEQIEHTKNRKNTVVITSDNNLKEFARVCGCEVLSSEKFGELLTQKKIFSEEKPSMDSKNDIEEYKRLFGSK
jgi:predicted RNA-binding protein with PIN domain